MPNIRKTQKEKLKQMAEAQKRKKQQESDVAQMTLA